MSPEMTNGLRSAPVTPVANRGRRILRVAGRTAVAATVLAATVMVVPLLTPGGGRVIEAAGEVTGAGGEYHELAPQRVLDTRDPALDVAPLGRKPFSTVATPQVFNVQIVGHGGLPAFVDGNADCADDNVLAVAVNITVVYPQSLGYLRAFGKDGTEGDSSVVNFNANQVVSNTAVLRPGCNGELSIRAFSPNPGSVDVLIDVFGWFSSSTYGTRGARLEPVAPGRILDTREAAYGDTPLGAGQSRKIQIRGTTVTTPAVPTGTDVVGVLVNLTGVNNIGGSQATFLSLLPAEPAPGAIVTTSNLNLNRSQIRSNAAIVPLSADGAIWVYNPLGNTDVIVDVLGYFVQRPDATMRGRVVPLVSPFRAFDTREEEFANQPLPPGTGEDWSFTDFVNDVKHGNNAWVGEQIGLIGNLTATELTRQYSWVPVQSYITAYPTPAGVGAQPPLISNLGISEGESVPNLVVLPYGTAGTDTHQVRFYNKFGYVDYFLDVSAVILA
jgi:hypothetical protein